MKRLVSTPLILIFLLSAAAFAETKTTSTSEPTYVVDTPVVGVLDYGAYDLNFRLFSGGGLLTRLNFGVFQIVNLGFGWELARMIGNQDITVGPPALYMKIKLYSGGFSLPAMALGYDGQGYFYNKDTSEFLQKEKGIFLVFGREYFVPGLEINFGANMNDFKENKLMGFMNMSFNFEEKLYLLAEYDNVNYLPDSRLNLGFRFFISNSVSIDLAGRDIGAGERKAERILRIGYRGNF